MLPVSGPEQPVWSYKVIHSLWLPLLGLSVHEKTKLHATDGFYQHRAQGQFCKGPNMPQDLPLPAFT